VAALAALALALVAGLIWLVRERTAYNGERNGGIRSIAVLPLQLLFSGNPEQDYLSMA